ncbi:MAG: hypothetical protein MJK10_15505 [Pseudomonadales bacterium]|nr:hypothetical protein [Pseudomonadales bacterium]NRA17590.1 hypothetical protein [Oceanospirillaceae bacterium]
MIGVAKLEQAFCMLLAGRVELLMPQDEPGYHGLNLLFSDKDRKSLIHKEE